MLYSDDLFILFYFSLLRLQSVEFDNSLGPNFHNESTFCSADGSNFLVSIAAVPYLS